MIVCSLISSTLSVSFKLSTTMDDKNVLYGGDFEKWSEMNYPSLGALIIDRLKIGNFKEKNFINGLTDERWSRHDLFYKSISIAKALHNIGVHQNDMVSIVSDSRHDYVATAFSVFYLNAILAPVNFSYTERELKHAFDLSKPKVVFASSLSIKNVVAVCEGLDYVEKIILYDGESIKSSKVTSLKNFIEENSRNYFDVFEYVKKPVKFEEQSSVIFLSSGTTGAPKGVELSQKNFIAAYRSNVEGMIECKKTAGSLRFLGIAPLSHVMGFFGTLFSLLADNIDMIVFLPRFELKLYLSLIEKFKITIILVAPPILVLMSKNPLLDEFDLSSLKLIYSGAAPLTKEVENQVKARLKEVPIIIQGYGMSETTYGLLGSHKAIKPGSVGTIRKGCYVKVVDSNGKSLGPNKVGEIYFKGSYIMKGYLNNSKATNEIIDKDGWLHTGDLGYYDNDQEFFIVDRLKELIKYKAYQVPPAELEGLLLSNPKIKDCGVIGIADESAGELPFAFVVKQPNVELTEDEVKNFVKQNASNAKWLRGGVKFIEEIPKNPSGKILRRELRELFKSMRAKL